MALFKRGQSDDRASRDAAAQAEVDRIVALPPTELGAELIDAFGPEGARGKGKLGTAAMQIVEWKMASYGRGVSWKPLVPAVLAGMQALEHAGLVDVRVSGTGSGGRMYVLTPAGETALANGSAARHLQ